MGDWRSILYGIGLFAVVLLIDAQSVQADIEQSIALCRNPTEAQRQRLEIVASEVGMSYAPGNCEKLYAILSKQKNKG